jgi:flavorubredoxin
MPSAKALRYALKRILDIPFTMIAPQHGSVINDKQIMRYVFEQLSTLKGVGIDALVEDGFDFTFGDLKERFR